MNIRLLSGWILIKFSNFIRQSLIALLKPQDLIEFTKINYSKSQAIKVSSDEECLSRGLIPIEKDFIENHAFQKGRILVLGCGGGRESIALTEIGFNVIGIDNVKEMIEKGKENSIKRGFNIDFYLQDITACSFPDRYFDYAMLSANIYGTIPTKKKRIEFLKNIRKFLKAGGKFFFTFHIANSYPKDRRFLNLFTFNLLKVIAYITFGNIGYQYGDKITYDGEFHHSFSDKQEIYSEIKAADFREIELEDSYAVVTP